MSDLRYDSKAIGGMGGEGMIYKLFHIPWFFVSQFFEEHPDCMSDWECQCHLCLSYLDPEHGAVE